MSLMNYDRVRRWFDRGETDTGTAYLVHKRSNRTAPRVSIILLDWSCRESLHALDWLQQQSIPRDAYELIWIDLYDRVPAEALEKADTVITLSQRGLYHKHIGYNVGLLEAKGELITVCDSDAVFPEDFIESLLKSFDPFAAGTCRPQVLMHYEARTSLKYPQGLKRASDLKDNVRWKWRELHPNVGACMTVRREDALRFGGFDEHSSYRGYLCGPYDLGWRLVNAGLPEIWHNPSVILWHFAHPDPVGSSGVIPSLWTRLETVAPHIDLHALTAVEHFSTGQLLPRQENPRIHTQRMAARTIGTNYEDRFATLPMRRPLSGWQRGVLRGQMLFHVLKAWTLESIGQVARQVMGPETWSGLKSRVRSLMSRPAVAPSPLTSREP